MKSLFSCYINSLPLCSALPTLIHVRTNKVYHSSSMLPQLYVILLVKKITSCKTNTLKACQRLKNAKQDEGESGPIITTQCPNDPQSRCNVALLGH